MNEKIFELFDLLFSLILLGSLIRQIPIVDKVLTGIENFFDFISKHLPNKTDHEWIVLGAKFFGYISILFLILFLTFSKREGGVAISPKISLSFMSLFLFSLFLWLSLNIAKPSKKQIINFIKSNSLFLLCPFIFLACDLLLETHILESFSQKFFNLFLSIFDLQIPNFLWGNFLAFASIFYVGTALPLIIMWGSAQPTYLAFLLLLKIMRHPQKQERILFFVLLAFFINKLALIFFF